MLGYGNAFEPHRRDAPRQGSAIRRAMAAALRMAELQPDDLGHVNAHGLSTTEDDRLEAQAIREIVGDVPVTALKSYFGNLGTGSGIVELAASVLSFARGRAAADAQLPATRPAVPCQRAARPAASRGRASRAETQPHDDGAGGGCGGGRPLAQPFATAHAVEDGKISLYAITLAAAGRRNGAQ